MYTICVQISTSSTQIDALYSVLKFLTEVRDGFVENAPGNWSDFWGGHIKQQM